MAYIDFVGSGGSVRVNYTETVNKTARTSTITFTSVQVKSNVVNSVAFSMGGKIKIGGTTVLDMERQNIFVASYYTDPVYSTATWYTVYNVDQRSVTVPNDGTGNVATIALDEHTYNEGFIAFAGSDKNNVVCQPTTKTIILTSYSTGSESTVSAVSPVTLGDLSRVTITRKSTSYMHKLYYSFDKTVWTPMLSGSVSTSYDFDTSVTIDYFETQSERICYIKCETYSGTTFIGSNNTAIVITTEGIPVISSIVADPINTNPVISGWDGGRIFVQGYSTIYILVSTIMPVGATLSNCKISINGTVVSDSLATRFTTTSPIADSGIVRIYVTVTDSNGKSRSSSKTITVYPYSRPYASVVDAIRYSSNVNVEDKENGTNISAKATIGYSSVNGYNTAGVKVRYKPVGGAYSTATSLTSGNINHVKINGSTVLSTTTSYTVQFVIYDALHPENVDPTMVEIVIPTSAVTIHVKDGGTGIAFGGYNSLDAAQIWLDTYLYGRLIIPSSMYGVPAPSTDGAEVGQVYFQFIN